MCDYLLKIGKRAKIVQLVAKNMSNPDQVIMTFGEFLADAETNDLFQQVADEIVQEQKETLVVDANVRRDEEWGVLANQVVGRENCRPA